MPALETHHPGCDVPVSRGRGMQGIEGRHGGLRRVETAGCVVGLGLEARKAGSCVMQREVGFGGKRRGVERSGVRGLGIARRLNPTPASTPCRSTAQLRPLRMDNFHRYGGLGRAGCERRQRVVDCRQYDDAVQGSRSPLDSPPLWCPLPSGAGPHVLSVRGSALS
jgi:hypothetical protein